MGISPKSRFLEKTFFFYQRTTLTQIPTQIGLKKPNCYETRSHFKMYFTYCGTKHVRFLKKKKKSHSKNCSELCRYSHILKYSSQNQIQVRLNTNNCFRLAALAYCNVARSEIAL